MKRLKRVSWVILLVLFTTGSAWANNIGTLDYLFAGNSILAGDKLFDSWTLLDYTSTDTSRSFNPANIGVSPINSGGNNPGPGLEYTAFNDELYVIGDGFIELSFGFHVKVLDPNLLIKDNSLELLTFAASGGGGGSSIYESIGTSAGGDDLGTKEVGFIIDQGDGFGGTFNLFDSVIFTPQTDIWVTTDIMVWASSPDQWTRLSGFDQRFSQTPIPEPSTFLLLGAGLAGLGLVVRRRRKG